MLGTYYTTNPTANSITTGFSLDLINAIEKGVEKKAIYTAMVQTYLRTDPLLNHIGKFNMECLFTKEWENDDVASLSAFYVA